MVERVGQQLGNYRLTRLLGRGGFADVYLGEHVHIDTQAAIKVLLMQLAQNYQTEFKREANIIARLRHPHIVHIRDFGIENNTPYLIMDYAPKGTLRTHHSKGSIVELEKVVAYVKQIASALQYAHDHHLIHRDLKPENLLVVDDTDILLSDFGIAAIAQDTTTMVEKTFAGTIPYSAPEQILGKPRPASDQYSLGIVVYEWLTGELPFSGAWDAILSQQIAALPPPLHEKLPTVPPAVEAVVMKALSKEPKNRFEGVQAFADALEQAYLASIRPKRSELVGQQFDNYRFVRLLAAGSTSFVYLAEHLQLGTRAAIKIPQEYINTEEFQNRMRLNIRLVHPHIVRLLNVGVKDQIPFVVMDFASHGTLRDRHPRGSRLPLSTVVSYTKQVASALQYAHNQNLLHGNVHPGTMLVGDNDEIFLTSFYSVFADRTKEPFSIGPYTAPEQITDKLIPASDQYALGAAVYEWLCGDYHLKWTSFEAPYIQLLRTPPTSLHEKNPRISAAVEAVVMKALAKDPKQRFGSVQEFADRFEQASMLQQRSDQWRSIFWHQVRNALSEGSTTILRASRITWNELAKILGANRITRRKVLAGLGLTGLAIAGSWLLFSPTFHPQYLYKKSITIHHKNVRSNLSNFPVLISLSDSDLKIAANGGYVQNNKGYDIIFTDSTETITLDHEIEKYVPTTGEITMWVRVPTLSASSDIVIYMHFGNSSISSSQENKTGVWDSHYIMVQHLQETGICPVTFADSTLNGKYGSCTNSPAPDAKGKIGGSRYFNGSNTLITEPPNLIGKNTVITLSAWFRTSTAGVIVGCQGDKYPNSPNTKIPLLYVGADGKLLGGFWIGSLTNIASSGTVADGNWHYAVLVGDTTGESLYLDGALINSLSGPISSDMYNQFGGGIWAPWPDKGSGFWSIFDGSLDELRISNTVRSADWIATEYNSQNSPSTFYTVHPTPTPTLTPTPTPLPLGKLLLYLFVRGTDSRIYVNTTSNGSAWNSWSQVSGGFQTLSAPSVAQYENTLYLFARDFTTSLIYVNTTSNGSTWSGWSQVSGNDLSLDAPGVATYMAT